MPLPLLTTQLKYQCSSRAALWPTQGCGHLGIHLHLQLAGRITKYALIAGAQASLRFAMYINSTGRSPHS